MVQPGRILVAMSGGVDSTVAALLLLRQGWKAEGATFRLRDGLPGDDAGADSDVREARAACELLGIAHHVLDFRDRFRRDVVDDFARQYAHGATPNPCVVCNRAIKFGAFLDTALEMGCDRIATGHYASAEYDGSRGRYCLRRSPAGKDQSYVLYRLSQHQLAHTVFPLSLYDKEQVRRLAREAGLTVESRADSQDICFVPDGDYGAFLEAYTGSVPAPGDFLDESGAVVGRHKGIWHYTVGQRKGLGVSFGKPVYVGRIDAAANTVTLTDNQSLFVDVLTAQNPAFIDFDRLEQPMECAAKIRYSAGAAPARIFPLEDGVRVEFQQPQRAATPGQSVVFNDGDYVVGGAVIA